MKAWLLALALAATAAAGCGDTTTSRPEDRPSTTHPTSEPCERPTEDILVTRETGGFSPHSTLVVRADGYAWASAGPAFGGPRCYSVPAATLEGVRASLEAVDLHSLAPWYRGSTQGPEGMVIEIDTYSITKGDVTVGADSNAVVPDGLRELDEALGRVEGMVVERG
jgi:hypothetical protein